MKNKPVATMTMIATVALAALTALAGTGVLSGKAAAIVAAAIAVLNAGLGILVHDAVTPLANPKDSSGRPLVPLK